MAPAEQPPPPPDPKRILGERSLSPRPGTPPVEPGDGNSPNKRLKIALIVLAAAVLGLAAATAVVLAEGPEERVLTSTTTSTKRVQPTTTTVSTTVVTTVVSTITTTNRTVTETATETVTEEVESGGGGEVGDGD